MGTVDEPKSVVEGIDVRSENASVEAKVTVENAVIPDVVTFNVDVSAGCVSMNVEPTLEPLVVCSCLLLTVDVCSISSVIRGSAVVIPSVVCDVVLYIFIVWYSKAVDFCDISTSVHGDGRRVLA